MIEPTYKNLVKSLLEAVPEIKEEYEKNFKDWENLPHLVFGSFLTPYVEKLLLKNDEEKLKNIFSFMETLANHEDTKVREVVKDSFCENLEDGDREIKKRARKFMGPKTVELAVYNTN